MPTQVLLDEEGTRLFADSRIMLEQVRTIDRERLKEYIGSANAATMQYVDHAKLLTENQRLQKALNKKSLNIIKNL